MAWEYLGWHVYMIMPMHEEWKVWTCTCGMYMHDAFLNDHMQINMLTSAKTHVYVETW